MGSLLQYIVVDHAVASHSEQKTNMEMRLLADLQEKTKGNKEKKDVSTCTEKGTAVESQ